VYVVRLDFGTQCMGLHKDSLTGEVCLTLLNKVTSFDTIEQAEQAITDFSGGDAYTKSKLIIVGGEYAKQKET